MSRKFQFVMNERLAEVVETIKTKTDRDNYAEVIRDALKAYLWIINEYESGREILSRASDPQAIPMSPVFSTNLLTRAGRAGMS